MKASKTWLAGMLLSSVSAIAAADDQLPTICKSVINYNVQMLSVRLSDGTFGDKSDPSSIRIHKNLANYPITKVTDLGSCDDDGAKLKPGWCKVAGGPGEVTQVEVGEADLSNKSKPTVYPFATMVVTYNRGYCWVAESSLE